MYIFQINILTFSIYISSTCFEPDGLSSGRWLYIQLWYGMVWYGMFYMHQYKQSCR